ncbi:MAG: isochorismatase family protein [Inhella sp.]
MSAELLDADRCALILVAYQARLMPALHDGAIAAERAARHTLVRAGCEAHVCLLRTALGLLRAGKSVWVVANACASGRPADQQLAMQRLAQAGAQLVSHEMVLFEWLRDCRHPALRALLPGIKAER